MPKKVGSENDVTKSLVPPTTISIDRLLSFGKVNKTVKTENWWDNFFLARERAKAAEKRFFFERRQRIKLEQQQIAEKRREVKQEEAKLAQAEKKKKCRLKHQFDWDKESPEDRHRRQCPLDIAPTNRWPGRLFSYGQD